MRAIVRHVFYYRKLGRCGEDDSSEDGGDGSDIVRMVTNKYI